MLVRREVQLSDGAEMEAYYNNGDQAAAEVANFSGSLWRSQAGNFEISNIEWHNWHGQTEVA